MFRRSQPCFFSTGWRESTTKSWSCHFGLWYQGFQVNLQWAHFLCRLLANDRKVTRWAKKVSVLCGSKIGTKWLMFFAVLRKVDPIDNHTLELNCERYPKRVVQKHLAERDDTVDRRKFRSLTSDNMDSWKSRAEKQNHKMKSREEK